MYFVLLNIHLVLLIYIVQQIPDKKASAMCDNGNVLCHLKVCRFYWKFPHRYRCNTSGRRKISYSDLLFFVLKMGKKKSLFDDINSLMKEIIKGDISTDNIVFKLHRVFTVILLLIFSILISTNQVRLNYFWHKHMNYLKLMNQ